MQSAGEMRAGNLSIEKVGNEISTGACESVLLSNVITSLNVKSFERFLRSWNLSGEHFGNNIIREACEVFDVVTNGNVKPFECCLRAGNLRGEQVSTNIITGSGAKVVCDVVTSHEI